MRMRWRQRSGMDGWTNKGQQGEGRGEQACLCLDEALLETFVCLSSASVSASCLCRLCLSLPSFSLSRICPVSSRRLLHPLRGATEEKESSFSHSFSLFPPCLPVFPMYLFDENHARATVTKT